MFYFVMPNFSLDGQALRCPKCSGPVPSEGSTTCCSQCGCQVELASRLLQAEHTRKLFVEGLRCLERGDTKGEPATQALH